MQKYEPPHSEVMFVMTVTSQSATAQPFHSGFTAMMDTGPQLSDTPLYLLSSSLLI
jgi:hypothetical protein